MDLRVPDPGPPSRLHAPLDPFAAIEDPRRQHRVADPLSDGILLDASRLSLPSSIPVRLGVSIAVPALPTRCSGFQTPRSGEFLIDSIRGAFLPLVIATMMACDHGRP